MPRLEEIAYDAGRHALADQEAFVAGIRQRAGTLLAAHALVASFLGATALREAGATPLTWLALAALVAGLTIAAILLAPTRIVSTIAADEVYATAMRSADLSDPDDLTWLASVGFSYQRIVDGNVQMVRWMTRLSIALATLVVVHALFWIAALMGVE